jgi:catechol 2,3-dioxygenase-like lactoylglutathione lyase family enzyme
MIRCLEIAFIGYPSTDLARSRQFYETVLGLTPSTPPTAASRWIEYNIGPGTLALGQSPNWPPAPDGPSAALEVENFDETVAALRTKGVAFLIGPLETPVCHMVVIRDPDGNRLTLHRRKQG